MIPLRRRRGLCRLPMGASQRTFPARTAALADVTAFVEGRCRTLRASRAATLRLLLAAEELFINAVVHGYGGDGDGTVRLAVRRAGRCIELVQADDAPPFHPFRRLPAASARKVAQRPGGLGRVLAARLTDRRRWQGEGGGNCVTVAVRSRAAPARAAKKKNKKKL